MCSFGVVLLLTARSLPRVEEDPPGTKPSFLDRWAASELPEKIDMALNSFLAKFLRKLRVALLRVDNNITGWLKKVKAENGKTESLMKEIAERENGQSMNDV